MKKYFSQKAGFTKIFECYQQHFTQLTSFRIVPFSEKYSKIMYAVQEASEYGKQENAVCANKYNW